MSDKLIFFQLVGRDVDLNKLLSQRMNEAIHKSLEVAINRFEEGDITGVMVILISYNNVTFCTAQEIQSVF